MLANEEVIGGLSERGSHPVVRMPLRQWMLRITAYADRLEKDLDELDWPEASRRCSATGSAAAPGPRSIFSSAARTARSAASRTRKNSKPGANAGGLGLSGHPGSDVLRVFTTRPDTLYGATYMVLAPEHPLVAG